MYTPGGYRCETILISFYIKIHDLWKETWENYSIANKEGSWVMSSLNIASRSVETVSSHFKISEHLIKELLRQLTWLLQVTLEAISRWFEDCVSGWHEFLFQNCSPVLERTNSIENAGWSGGNWLRIKEITGKLSF